MTKTERKYDLEERTLIFAKQIISFCKKIPSNTINFKLIDQLIRSGTSIGANYMEANGASSKKDFKSKIFICKKEAMETKYWLRILVKAENSVTLECRNLWREAQELNLILAAISRNARQNSTRDEPT